MKNIFLSPFIQATLCGMVLIWFASKHPIKIEHSYNSTKYSAMHVCHEHTLPYNAHIEVSHSGRIGN